jgi:peptidoglycan L-alanyl-D-glutamate endopeptidase CwlK
MKTLKEMVKMTNNPQMPCRDLNELHPYVKTLAERLIAECKKSGIDIIVTQTYRSMEYQQQLYNQGRTTPGKIVTNCRPGWSPHNYRLAFDVCINSKTDPYNEKLLDKVGAIGEKIGLTWGGHFKSFVDKPHFEWTGGLSIRQLIAGQRPIAPDAKEDYPTLKLGDKGSIVTKLQKLLYNKGQHIPANGSFDELTKQAVINFQKQNGLTPDGIVGEKTWEALSC